MSEDTTASIQRACEAFAEAADRWREEVLGAPDVYLDVSVRMAPESITVAFGPRGNGTRPGRVERRIIVHVGSQQGPALLNVTAETITHGVWTIIGMIAEAAALGVGRGAARHEWERAYYLRLRGSDTVVMCSGCRAFGARAGRGDVPEGWTGDADDPDELRCPECVL